MRVVVSLNRFMGIESYEMFSEVDMRYFGVVGRSGVERDLVWSWRLWLLEYDWVLVTRV